MRLVGSFALIVALAGAAAQAAPTQRHKEKRPDAPVGATVEADIVPLPVAPQVAVETPNDSARIQRALQEIVTLDIEVTGGGERLWSGTLRVNSQQNADYRATLQQARPACAGADPTRNIYNGEQNQLSVSISRRGWGRDIDGFMAQVNWTRPLNSCETGAGQATVGFNREFVLRPQAVTQLAGDGGLVVKIARRN